MIHGVELREIWLTLLFPSKIGSACAEAHMEDVAKEIPKCNLYDGAVRLALFKSISSKHRLTVHNILSYA